MKRILVLLLAFALTLCGCAAGKTAPQQPTVAGAAYEQFTPERKVLAPLDFLTADNSRLAVEMREIAIRAGETTVEAVMNELLKGPQSDADLRTVLKSVRLESAEVSRDVAYIDLSEEARAGLEYESDTIRFRAMIANTLCDLLGVDFVNITVGGMEPGYTNVPLGSMKRLNTDLTLYIEQVTRAIIDNDYPMLLTLTLYFPDRSGTYLLCEAREVQLEDSNSIDLVIQELLKGPRNTSEMQGIVNASASYSVEAPPPITGEGEAAQDALGAYERLVVNFSEGPTVRDELARGALVCSLMGFVPRTEGVSVQFHSDADSAVVVGEDAYKTHADYADLIGTNATLYYPAESSNTLGALARAIPQGLAEDPAVLLLELMKDAPKGYRNVFPEGVTENMLIDAVLSDDIAVLNFSSGFYELCQSVASDDDAVMLMIYSIVNTLTEISGINRVQFLRDGGQIDNLGVIKLYGPLMRSPGLIA